jgi:diguanylate cyclase (GGDEF)-like protein
MSTHINNLHTITSSVTTKDNLLISSRKFVSPPNAEIGDSDHKVWRVRFEILKTDNPIHLCLEINSEIILGVEDSQSDVINLLDYDNKITGVSRRHLKLMPTETDLLMIDLNSTNGTRQNGRFVQPNTPYSIFNGDILELGNMLLAITIENTPHDQCITTDKTKNLINALTHISTTITSNLNADDILDRILEIAANLCQVDELALLLRDEYTNELHLCTERGIGDGKTWFLKVPINQDLPVNKVLQTGSPSRSIMNNDCKHEVVTGYLVEAACYVPINAGESSIGILIAMRKNKKNDFTRDDESMLSAVGKYVAIAIQNSQIYEMTNLKLQSKVNELATYNAISKELSKTNNLTGIYDVLRDQIREHWKIDNIGLWLVEKTTNHLVPFPKPSFYKTYAIGEEMIGDVASRVEPILTTNIRLFSEPTKTLESTLQLLARSAICVPIVENNKVLGVLAVFSTQENEFNNNDINLLQTFSQAASSAIRNAWLFEQVDNQRATILAAVNMLPHPIMIVDQDGKIIVSNKAANTMIEELNPMSINGEERSKEDHLISLTTLMNDLSESKWSTKEIIVGDKVYVATLEYASMVGTIILMQDVTDPITGTSNHRHFHELAEQAFQQAKRYTKPLAALTIGFGDLREVIIEQGYTAGNQILKRLASELRGFLRTPDMLGRYLDNEFIAVLPETSLENAMAVARRIVQSMSKTSIIVENHKIVPKLTIGVAVLDFNKDDSVDVFMEKAHQTYMAAKSEKRQIKVRQNI